MASGMSEPEAMPRKTLKLESVWQLAKQNMVEKH